MLKPTSSRFETDTWISGFRSVLSHLSEQLLFSSSQPPHALEKALPSPTPASSPLSFKVRLEPISDKSSSSRLKPFPPGKVSLSPQWSVTLTLIFQLRIWRQWVFSKALQVRRAGTRWPYQVATRGALRSEQPGSAVNPRAQEQWFLTLAAHLNHQGSSETHQCQAPSPEILTSLVWVTSAMCFGYTPQLLF